jgi:hypothetical protein
MTAGVLHLLAAWCGWFAKRLLILPKAAHRYCCSAAAAAAVVLCYAHRGGVIWRCTSGKGGVEAAEQLRKAQLAAGMHCMPEAEEQPENPCTSMSSSGGSPTQMLCQHVMTVTGCDIKWQSSGLTALMSVSAEADMPLV